MSTFQFVVLCLLALVVIGLQLKMSRKIRRIDLHTWDGPDRVERAVAQCFQQLEALQGLYWDIKPVLSLPPTRGWAGSPDFLRELASYVLASRPEVVVECSSGVSTVVTARCLQQLGKGHVYSLEHAPEYAQATRDLLARHGLSEWATVVDAPLIPTATDRGSQPWYEVTGLPVLPIDLLVIDGPPTDTAALARYPAGPVLFDRLSASGTVFLDDADRPDERAIVDRWLQRHHDLELRRVACEKGLSVLKRKPAP